MLDSDDEGDGEDPPESVVSQSVEDLTKDVSEPDGCYCEMLTPHVCVCVCLRRCLVTVMKMTWLAPPTVVT